MSQPVTNLIVSTLLLFCCSESLLGQTVVDLTVDQSQSFATVSVLGGSDVTSISGTAVLQLDAPAEPFSTAQISELDLTMADGFSILLLAGTVEVSVDPNGATVMFVQVGGPGMVNASNQFDQVGNLFGVTGMSMIDSLFGDEVIDLSTVKPVPFDIVGAQITVDGTQLTLEAQVNIDFDFEVIGGNATMNLNGPLVLTGNLPEETDIPGDLNCDGAVDLLDVAPFVAALSSGEFNPKADITGDGIVNLLDVQPFVDLLAG